MNAIKSLFLGLFFLHLATAHATDCVWKGGASTTDWSNSQNWMPSSGYWNCRFPPDLLAIF
jgi:hypothetical protein